MKLGSTSFYEAVWALVRKVPRGRVVTYGQVATWLGSPRAARAVGYAMFNVQDPKVPWHRVVNSKGEVSFGGHLHRPDMQKNLLRKEGVKLDQAGRIDLDQCRHDFPVKEAVGVRKKTPRRARKRR